MRRASGRNSVTLAMQTSCAIRVAGILLVLTMTVGCAVEGPIQVDSTAEPVRFIVDHRGWPRPFWSPRITEFAIASEADGPIWQLESADAIGVPAKQLAFLYGEVPPGFVQLFPEQARRPIRLKPSRNYFVAAGGPKAVFKMVFAVPVDGYTPVLPDVGNVGATSAPAEPSSQPSAP